MYILTKALCFFLVLMSSGSLISQTDIPTYCPDDFRLILSELGQNKSLSLSEMTDFKRLLKGMPAKTHRQKNEFTGEMNDVILVEDSEFIYHMNDLTSFRIKNDIIQLEIQRGKIVYAGMSAQSLKQLFPIEADLVQRSYLDDQNEFIQLQLCHPIYPESRVRDQTLVIAWDSKTQLVNSIHISSL